MDTKNYCYSTVGFAEKWGVTAETVQRWCRENKIDATQDDPEKPWRIAEDATPPKGYHKKTKSTKV